MSPRPRTTTDEAILEAAQRAVLRVGPMRLTLADVGREAGVTPATLVKRFGSKRDLLLALIASGSEGPSAQFEQLSAIRSPVAAIYAYAACMADLAASPEILANNLAFLQMDLVDPEFHAHTLRHSNGVRRWIQSRLEQAVAAGELRACDTPRLARAVQVVVGGSLLQWAIDRKGALRRRLREDVETLLQPYAPRQASRRVPAQH